MVIWSVIPHTNAVKRCSLSNGQGNKPCGKESTEVRKSQNKGKESENSYQKLKRSLKDRHTKTTTLDISSSSTKDQEILL